MWRKIWEGITGLFGGKGGVQIGRGNQSNTTTNTITAGRDAHIGDVHQYHVIPPAPRTDVIPFEPTTEEFNILESLSPLESQPLQLLEADNGFGWDVFFIGKANTSHFDIVNIRRYYNALRRLADHGILIETQNRLYILAEEWRPAVERALATHRATEQRQLPSAGGPS